MEPCTTCGFDGTRGRGCLDCTPDEMPLLAAMLGRSGPCSYMDAAERKPWLREQSKAEPRKKRESWR